MDDELRKIIEIHDLQEWRASAGRLERDAWLMAARQIFSPGKREPCWVCGKFLSITQAHHAIPLTTQYDRGFKYPDQSLVWLCPNHHALAHLFIMDDRRSMTEAAFAARDRAREHVHSDLSEDEYEKMIQLMRLAGRGPE